MLYGYGILNNHVPTLKATVMKISAAISTLLTGLYAVYKGESNALASLTTSLYAVYKGESNGNDSLGIYNATAVSGGVTYTAGKSGNCFVANGINSEITFSDVFKFSDSSTNAFSFSFWCNFSDNGTVPQSIFSNFWQTSVYYGYMIWYYNNVVTFSRYNGTTTPIAISSGTLTTSTWYNIAITRKDGSTKMYINGSLVASDTSTTSIVYTTTHYPRMLSRKTDAGVPNWFLGSGSKVDELNIWNKELTATEIADLYNSGNGKFYQGNTFYSTVVNDSLATYNGTAQGGLTYTTGKSGNAFTFNGTDAYVSLPNNTFKFLSDFSVSLWFYCKTSSNAQTLINGYDYNGSASGGWVLNVFGSTNFLEYQTYINTQAGSKSRYRIPFNTGTYNNQWVHIVLTRVSSTSTKVYINGTEVSGSFFTGSVSDNPTYLTNCYSEIGGDFVTSGGFINPCDNGTKIDEVNVWTKELTSTEVTELYNAGAGKFYPY